MSNRVEIQGATSQQEMSAKAQMTAEVEESAKEMDMIKPLPVETTIPSRDLKEKKSPEAKIKEAKEANDETQSAIREASPVKAKKRQVRKRKNTEPTPPEGTPSVDYLKIMQERFDRMEEYSRVTSDRLADLYKVYASETGLQQNGVIPQGKRLRKEGPNDNSSFVEMDSGDNPRRIPMRSNTQQAPPARRVSNTPAVDTHEVDLYRRRNKDALESMIYDTEETMHNRSNNSTNPTSHFFNKW